MRQKSDSVTMSIVAIVGLCVEWKKNTCNCNLALKLELGILATVQMDKLLLGQQKILKLNL